MAQPVSVALSPCLSAASKAERLVQAIDQGPTVPVLAVPMFSATAKSHSLAPPPNSRTTPSSARCTCSAIAIGNTRLGFCGIPGGGACRG